MRCIETFDSVGIWGSDPHAAWAILTDALSPVSPQDWLRKRFGLGVAD
jgi:hypothetical protein